MCNDLKFCQLICIYKTDFNYNFVNYTIVYNATFKSVLTYWLCDIN